jgi:hypothetical protein
MIYSHTHTCTYTNTHLILSDDRLVFKLKSVLLSIRWVLQVYKRYKRYILLFSYYIGNYIWLSILIAYIDWCVWETESVRARAEAWLFCVYWLGIQYETVYVLKNLYHFVCVRVDVLARCEHFVFWPAFCYLSALFNCSKALPTPASLLI